MMIKSILKRPLSPHGIEKRAGGPYDAHEALDASALLPGALKRAGRAGAEGGLRPFFKTR